jgi:uncharacterized protein (DUF427 family)
MPKDPPAAKRPHPAGRITFEPCAKRVRVIFNGETIADSKAVRLLHESGHVPIKGHLCFFNEKVDAIVLDGEALPRLETRWS